MKFNPEKFVVARRAAGLSTRALAAKAGVSAQTVNRAERGKHVPFGLTLAAMCKALGVEVREVCDVDVP
jgi:transcriptional regulator with XRE-family HTH domain